MQSLVAMGEADFIEHFSSPLPAAVFGEWLGLTEQQTQVLWRTAQAYVKAWESFDKSSVAVAAAQLAEMAAEVIAERRREPRDPKRRSRPVRCWQRATTRGSHSRKRCSPGCVRQVLVVGLVAPPILLGSIAVHLSRDPQLQQQLRGDPSLVARCGGGIPAAVHALSRVRAFRAARSGVAWPAHPAGRAHRAGVRLGESGRVRFSRSRTSSGCAGPISGSTWHSDAGRTCAPASRWRGRSCASRWKNCSRKPVTSRSVASSG